MKFKLGDRVKIKRSSEFSYQSSEVGTIVEVSDFNEQYPYGVEFNNKYHNSYRDTDLELLELTKNPIFLADAKRSSLIKRIIKIIKSNKDYLNCFNDTEKEVKSWSDTQLKNFFVK